MNTQNALQAYLNQVGNKLITHFDVYQEGKLGEVPLTFMALYKRRDEKYVMSKKIKVWGVENQQCVFVTMCDRPVSIKLIEQLSHEIQCCYPAYISAKQEHMSTVYLGIVVTEHSVEDRVVREVMRYRKLKFFKWGWYGWAEMYIGIVSLQDGKVIIHPKGRPFTEPFTITLKKGRK